MAVTAVLKRCYKVVKTGKNCVIRRTQMKGASENGHNWGGTNIAVTSGLIGHGTASRTFIPCPDPPCEFTRSHLGEGGVGVRSVNREGVFN